MKSRYELAKFMALWLVNNSPLADIHDVEELDSFGIDGHVDLVELSGAILEAMSRGNA